MPLPSWKKLSLQTSTEEESHHTSPLKVQLWLCRRVCREFQPAREIPRWPWPGPSEPTWGQSWHRHSWPSDFCSPGFGDKFKSIKFKSWAKSSVVLFNGQYAALINQCFILCLFTARWCHTHTHSIDITPPPHTHTHTHINTPLPKCSIDISFIHIILACMHVCCKGKKNRTFMFHQCKQDFLRSEKCVCMHVNVSILVTDPPQYC